MYLARKKRPGLKIISLGLSFVLIFSCLFPSPALAGRSSAGGGDLAEFDAGKFALSTVIQLGSSAIGSALQTGISSAWEGGNFLTTAVESLGNSFGFTGSTVESLGKIALSYTSSQAATQVGRAVGMMGNYYEWNPSLTYVLSSVASSAVRGFVNPASTLSPSILGISVRPITDVTLTTMLNGALVGGLSGLANSAVVVAIEGDRLRDKKSPRIGSLIAGMVADTATSNLSQQLVGVSGMGWKVQNPADWPKILPELVIKSASIAATHSLSKDYRFLSPLVDAVVEGVGSGIAQGLMPENKQPKPSLPDLYKPPVLSPQQPPPQPQQPLLPPQGVLTQLLKKEERSK